MSRGIRALIDLEALTHNFKIARRLAPSSKIMAVVKADAYGHGAVEVANTLTQADAFAVAGIEEAVVLRQAGITKEIVLLSGFHDVDDINECQRWDLTLVIHSLWQVNALSSHDFKKSLLRVWIKLDMGMHRLGINPDKLRTVIQQLNQQKNIFIVGVMSHLSNADETDNSITSKQREYFVKVVGPHKLEKSLANSAGVLAWPDLHYDWIRPGVMLYGCSPLQNVNEENWGLIPVMRLQAQIISINLIPAGESIGYGGTWRCTRDSQIGVIACGYGDGYPWQKSGSFRGSLNGDSCGIVGRVSMDLMAVDVTDIPQAKVGDWLDLWGDDPRVSEVAFAAHSSPYVLLASLAHRVPRYYQ